MQQFNLETATVEETKAMAYDVLSNIQRLQNDLHVLNSAITQKQEKINKEATNPIKK
jgi:hypothetical protein